ncbi:hypothetical protein [Nocardiopsis gilva]|uniref:hypothetical protein n=1 Tax=Nocardiopsis gilva TaxID=280236 RepID=UPI001E343675|nr:hypothetical protein [Nocardiopsis gilva]
MTAIVHQGDALQVLPTLPTGSVDALITDPPYNSGVAHPQSGAATPHAASTSAATPNTTSPTSPGTTATSAATSPG